MFLFCPQGRPTRARGKTSPRMTVVMFSVCYLTCSIDPGKLHKMNSSASGPGICALIYACLLMDCVACISVLPTRCLSRFDSACFRFRPVPRGQAHGCGGFTIASNQSTRATEDCAGQPRIVMTTSSSITTMATTKISSSQGLIWESPLAVSILILACVSHPNACRPLPHWPCPNICE